MIDVRHHLNRLKRRLQRDNGAAASMVLELLSALRRDALTVDLVNQACDLEIFERTTKTWEAVLRLIKKKT